MDAVASQHERHLVQRALAGDARAFQRLVELHDARVYRAALAIVGEPADARDVAQETWIKVWRGLAAFRGEASFVTWLTRLARNAAADHLRRRRVRRDAADRLADLDVVVTPLDAVEARQEVRHALGGLPAAQRRLVWLRHELDLRIDEIAVLLGIPEGTVKSRLHAAMTALRAHLSTNPDADTAPGAPGSTGAPPPRSWPGGAISPMLRPPADSRPTDAIARRRPRAAPRRRDEAPTPTSAARARSGRRRAATRCGACSDGTRRKVGSPSTPITATRRPRQHVASALGCVP